MGCKARKGINVLKVIACANMHQRVLLILYQTLILSVDNYGFCLTLSKTQLQRLEVIQNQGMRNILGCTRDTSFEAMRHRLGLLSMPERSKKGNYKHV